MDGSHFDDLIRSLTGSRRSLVGGGVALAAGRLAVFDAGAKKKRKRKPKKPRPNAYGCFEVGDACESKEQCCSGICEGKKGKRKCRAHGAGTCNQASAGFCTAADPAQALCNGSLSCVCLETTGGSTFCGSLSARPSGCADCRNDSDCLALGLPPGSACVPFSEGACAGACESGMVCVAPCEEAAASIARCRR